MIPEIGQFTLALALVLATLQCVGGVAGAWSSRPSLCIATTRMALAQLFCVALAFGCLIIAFVDYDYSVAYVAQNSNTALPLGYRIAAAWGGHEGSVLLWALVLAGWTVLVNIAGSRIDSRFQTAVSGILGGLSVGFLLFIILTSNPFARILPPLPEGRDLNPLLQDPGMVLHPPLLYFGYVGLAVPFAFAIAVLIKGEMEAAWLGWVRTWVLATWMCLTLGITLGSWWAYNELGWGGWWFWDPVENASFMPWLITTALIHSLLVNQQRGVFRAWTLLLCIVGFSLSLMGTFLVRSGVLTSVHAFANDPDRGVFVLLFLLLVSGSALLLFAWRAPRLSQPADFNLLSRETALLINNVLLVAAAAAIFLGTLYPLALESLGLGKISVGAPYFDQVFSLLMLPLLALLACGPLLRWRYDSWQRWWHWWRWSLLLALLLAVAITLGSTASPRWWLALGGLSMACWIGFNLVFEAYQRLRYQRTAAQTLSSASPPKLLFSRRFLAMAFAHLGVAVFTIGVVYASTWSEHADVHLAIGERHHLAGYEFQLTDIRQQSAANYVADIASIVVYRKQRQVALLHPEKRRYHSQDSAMTEAAIDSNPLRDLYIALGEPTDSGWTLRIYHKPLLLWLWVGAALMLIGGAIALSNRRFRTPETSTDANPAIDDHDALATMKPNPE